MISLFSMSKDTQKYTLLFDISHVIIEFIVSEISLIVQITVGPLLSILKDVAIIYSNRRCIYFALAMKSNVSEILFFFSFFYHFIYPGRTIWQ